MKIFQRPSILQHLVIGNKIYNLQSSWRWALYCRAHAWSLFTIPKSFQINELLKRYNFWNGYLLRNRAFHSCIQVDHQRWSFTLEEGQIECQSYGLLHTRTIFLFQNDCFQFLSHLHSLGGISFLGYSSNKK